MTSEIEQANFDRVDLKEVDGKIQLTFNHHSDWVIFLRKISIHKHLREDDDVNYFDDVLDCDHIFHAVSSANERYVAQKSNSKDLPAMQFEETGALETDDSTFDLIFQNLKRKVESGPGFKEISTPDVRNLLAKTSEVDLEDYDNYVKKYDGAAYNRHQIKMYFAPFLITDQQAEVIAERLGMRTDGFYGKAR